MKKLIVLVGLSLAFTLQAETLERTLMQDYRPVANMDFAFEIKTSFYTKIILDCQSFVTGMTFYKDKKVAHSIYLDAYGDCQNMHNYLQDSFTKKIPVCLEIETESNQLTVSHDSEGCQ